MSRHWRCAHGHTWTGELGALTFCPECGSADVYEVRRPDQTLDGNDPPDHGQTLVQPSPASPGQTFVQPQHGKPGETFRQSFDRPAATPEPPPDLTLNQPGFGQSDVG